MGKMGFMLYLDTVLIPFSLFLTLGYHAYLWKTFEQRPSSTKIGLEKLHREFWFRDIKQGDGKKGMLAVQSLRNTLMATILSASIAILVNLALAALTNNTYNASHLFNSEIFGSQSERIYALKYGLASLFLSISFLCSSMSVGFLIDANFLINAVSLDDDRFSYDPYSYTQTIFERGFSFAFVGNRVLCVAFPILLWMFGPLPVALSSAALVWGLYEFDFAPAKQIS
ncbi:hypothetical protein F3Y22_tig00113124pilonHSYRG00060 [Hibiscus syriacus]|uniref:DUF599 domain-containing protein n=1 Tax=Hibiscus syriacus TaxID=106335 RepID=A0A6A2XWN1_HIBSY|nr:uncharacterized protein LOC120185633 [Hibiscus syriacus]KAE8662789.1 hypothetical protein F3Y22_tig00113124pilonHSYRG00060 [Hibiscus syriacus]